MGEGRLLPAREGDRAGVGQVDLDPAVRADIPESQIVSKIAAVLARLAAWHEIATPLRRSPPACVRLGSYARTLGVLRMRRSAREVGEATSLTGWQS